MQATLFEATNNVTGSACYVQNETSDIMVDFAFFSSVLNFTQCHRKKYPKILPEKQTRVEQ